MKHIKGGFGTVSYYAVVGERGAVHLWKKANGDGTSYGLELRSRTGAGDTEHDDCWHGGTLSGAEEMCKQFFNRPDVMFGLLEGIAKERGLA